MKTTKKIFFKNIIFLIFKNKKPLCLPIVNFFLYGLKNCFSKQLPNSALIVNHYPKYKNLSISIYSKFNKILFKMIKIFIMLYNLNNFTKSTQGLLSIS